MEKKVLEKLKKNCDKTVVEVQSKDRKLTLTFKEKILLVNKKKTFTLVAGEDISNICLKCIAESAMHRVEFDGLRVHLTFEKVGSPTYNLSFKLAEILE
ncbi:MAG: hypothetical protein PHW22_00095 [Bacilli bacterium]|nr:hypothetical protein [Bacilli bacterium]